MVEAMFLVMGVALVAYVLTGGADFGGGFWHLVARGPRARAQRDAIEHAIAPIWEANHVWLIFLIVVMFTVYPRAFAVMSVALHVPIALALVGIVLRGASFVFKSYGLGPSAPRERWGHVFAWASAATPIFLGMVLGGVSSGAIRVDGSRVTSGFVAGWSSAFAIATGAFALSLFALLAAVYLTVDAGRDGRDDVRDDFRARAIGAEIVAGVLALVVFLLSGLDAPLLRERLLGSRSFMMIAVVTACTAIAALVALLRRRDRVARVLAMTQVALVVLGWGAAMQGDLVLGAVRYDAAGARAETLRGVVPALALGAVLLVPSLVVLFRIFKSSPERHRAR